MHELSIIAGLFDTLQEKARTHKAREITSVRLIVGKLSGVVPDLLESAFDAYKKGTIAENARLEIEEVPLKTRCRACGAEDRKEEFDIVCAACGSKDLEILQGAELVLERIELDSDEPESPRSS
jgi:hydrogenase nickel incorporation protein HypA/HybF